MTIQTSRFGTVEITEEDVLGFPEGLIGFHNLNKFVLLDDPNDELFAWLQSCEDPSIAFPVLEPELFAANYSVDLTKHELGSLNMEDMKRARVFCIVTIPEDATKMTANLKAPIVINVPQRRARQCVLQDSKLNIREPIFSKLQQRVVSAQPMRTPTEEWGVIVKLPPIEGPGHQPEINK